MTADYLTMINLYEMQQRLLSELEEAGSETIVTLLVTITDRTGEAGEVGIFRRALRDLVEQELVVIRAYKQFGHGPTMTKERCSRPG